MSILEKEKRLERVFDLNVNDTILALSSGARKRYREDILRVMAQPNGALIDFRYLEKWVSDEIVESRGSLASVPEFAVLAYLQTKPDIQIVPIRAAKVESIEIFANLWIFRFELLDFIKPSFPEKAFQRELEALGISLPYHDPNYDSVQGKFCLKAPNPEALVKTNSVGEDWLSLANLLSKKDDFKKSIILNIEGVYGDRGEKAKFENGTLLLNPYSSYEAHVLTTFWIKRGFQIKRFFYEHR